MSWLAGMEHAHFRCFFAKDFQSDVPAWCQLQNAAGSSWDAPKKVHNFDDHPPLPLA